MLAWRRNPSGLVGFALMSILAGTAWQVASVVIVALFYKGSAMAPMAMMIEIVLDPRHYLLFFVYVCAGGFLASLVFAVSVVSMPMLVDRQCDLLTALATSIREGIVTTLTAGPGHALARPCQLPRLQGSRRLAVSPRS